MLIRENHLNLIRKIAWSFHNSTRIDWQELFSEAALAYCEALEYYPREKKKTASVLWSFMKSRLIEYITKEREYYFPLNYLEGNFDFSEDPYYSFEYHPLLSSEETMQAAKKAMRNEKTTRLRLNTQYNWDSDMVDQKMMDIKILTLEL
jgi:hypothetical protein